MSDYPPNGYLTYWTLLGLETWGKSVADIAGPSLDWSEKELYRQIALFTSGTDEDSDAFQLGYNLLVQYRFRRAKLKPDIINLALKTLFSAQLDRGVWEKKDPLFVYGTSGDAYCFSFELLTALLTELKGEDGLEALKEFQSGLNRAVRWAERNQQHNNGFPVWRSGHRVNEPRPESWATAEVYLYFQLYIELLSLWIHQLLLKHFKGTPRAPAKKDAFAGLYQPEVKLSHEGRGAEFLLGKLLTERVIKPLAFGSGYSLVRQPDPKQCVRSGILFGPPGTGKTTYVRAIARLLGWPLVILDPSDFAREGMHLIPNTTARIFDHLLELEDTVIFFDEMEELFPSSPSRKSAFRSSRFRHRRCRLSLA